MSIGLKRGTVAVLPHKTEWDIAAQEIINKLKEILKDDIVDAQQELAGAGLQPILPQPCRCFFRGEQ